MRQVGLRCQHSGHDLGQRRGVKQAPSPERLAEAATERPDVAALVALLAADLFGRHVGRRADDHAGVGERRSDVGVGPALPRPQASEAEIEHLWRALLREHDVAGLEVAVNHPAFVRRRQGPRDVAAHSQRVDHLIRRPLQPGGERLPLDQLHDEETRYGRADRRRAVAARRQRLPDLEDLRDVGVVQRRQGARLALEADDAFGALEPLRQHLDRDVAAEARIVRPPHLAHPAAPQRRQHVEMPEDDAGGEHGGSMIRGPWAVGRGTWTGGHMPGVAARPSRPRGSAQEAPW